MIDFVAQIYKQQTWRNDATYCYTSLHYATQCNIIMSSNMAIPKTCSYCGKAYIAKTTMTRYCSLKCNSRHYKVKAKEDKIQNSLIEQQQTLQSLPTLQFANSNSLTSKNFLSVQDAAELIGVSRWTINRMIKRGELQIHKFGRKKIIQRTQIDKLFN